MEFSRGKIRQIRHLMVLAALLVLAIIYSQEVLRGAAFLVGIVSPFLVGGVMAFVLNIPMRAFEEKVLGRWQGKNAGKVKRPLCLTLSIVSLAVVLALVVGTVVPQVVSTASEIGRKIPAFTEEVMEGVDRLAKDYPELTRQIDQLELTEINWDSMLDSVIDFLKNGAGDVLNSTVSVASGIISGIVNTVIAFIFALYVLAQKEKLAEQGRRILSAYLPDKVGAKTLEIFSLLHKNFSSFITGQCLEAVILGTMFVVAMSLFGMPYALMVGVLIAFTALIPIVGGFIGCAVGAFMILIDNPLQALWFVILFLVLQQIEGNLIYPKVVGNSVGLPAIWVLVAVSVGGSLFGISGMLFFIPLTSSGYALLRESVNDRNARRRMQAAQRKGNRSEDEDVVMEEDGGTDAPAKKVPEAKAPERKAGERKNGKRL
ncbi:AI-2E family transporter [uncultured Acetatifactor sp.]|uniref:AI-2E family transporter n=1 Tax=uncultured Acetatifactor sp. TaxID=1671927 RepID=UPI0025FCB485|nr:AI-2E family transporter [uncultured Acetatifactor sp.]